MFLTTVVTDNNSYYRNLLSPFADAQMRGPPAGGAILKADALWPVTPQ